MTGIDTLTAIACLSALVSAQMIGLLVLWRCRGIVGANEVAGRLVALRGELTERSQELRSEIGMLEGRIRQEVISRLEESDRTVEGIRDAVDSRFFGMASRDRQNWEALNRAFHDQARSQQEQVETLRSLVDDKLEAFVMRLERERYSLGLALHQTPVLLSGTSSHGTIIRELR